MGSTTSVHLCRIVENDMSVSQALATTPVDEIVESMALVLACLQPSGLRTE